MTVAMKDPGKRHFYLSLVKSVLRMGACVFAFLCSYYLPIQVLLDGLLIAELVGHAEEL